MRSGRWPAGRVGSRLRLRFLTAFGDELPGETAAFCHAETRPNSALYRLRFLDHEMILLNPSHQVVSRLEAKCLSNRSGNHESPLGAHSDIGIPE